MSISASQIIKEVENKLQPEYSDKKRLQDHIDFKAAGFETRPHNKKIDDRFIESFADSTDGSIAYFMDNTDLIINEDVVKTFAEVLESHKGEVFDNDYEVEYDD